MPLINFLVAKRWIPCWEGNSQIECKAKRQAATGLASKSLNLSPHNKSSLLSLQMSFNRSFVFFVVNLSCSESQSPELFPLFLPTQCIVPPPAPTNDGASGSCAQWFTVSATKDERACTAALADGNISLDDFRKLNPFVNDKCTNLWMGTAYCVGSKQP